MSIEEMELFEAECKLLCYKGNMSRSNLGSFYNNEQTNWMYQMWLSSKNREGYKFVPKHHQENIKDALIIACDIKEDEQRFEDSLNYVHESMIASHDNN